MLRVRILKHHGDNTTTDFKTIYVIGYSYRSVVEAMNKVGLTPEGWQNGSRYSAQIEWVRQAKSSPLTIEGFQRRLMQLDIAP